MRGQPAAALDPVILAELAVDQEIGGVLAESGIRNLRQEGQVFGRQIEGRNMIGIGGRAGKLELDGSEYRLDGRKRHRLPVMIEVFVRQVIAILLADLLQADRA